MSTGNSKMMDLMNVKPGDAQRAMTPQTLPRRADPPRSVDLNQEIKLGGDDDDAPEQKPPTQEQQQNNKEGTTEQSAEVQNKEETTEQKTEKKDDTLDFDVPFDDNETQEEQQQQQDTDNTDEIPAGPRNYEDYPEELRKVLKALNNNQFKTFAPMLKTLHAKAAKADELEKQIKNGETGPRFQYEHPESYRLTPEFAQYQQDIQIGQEEIGHFTQQLNNIRKGLPWKNLAGYDKDGRPIYQDMPALQDGKIDIEAQSAVEDHLHKLRTAYGRIESEAFSFVRNYQAGVKKTSEEFVNIRKKLFPKFPDDPTKLEPADKAWYDMTVNALPVFRGHPLITNIIGPMSVTANRLRKQLTTVTQKLKVAEAKLGNRQLIEPSADEINNGSTGKSAKRNGRLIQVRKGNPIDPDEEIRFDQRD